MSLEIVLSNNNEYLDLREKFSVIREDPRSFSVSARSEGIVLDSDFRKLSGHDDFITIRSFELFKHIVQNLQDRYELRLGNELYGVNRTSYGTFEKDDQLSATVNFTPVNKKPNEYIVDVCFDNHDQRGLVMYQGLVRSKCKPMCALSVDSIQHKEDVNSINSKYTFFVVAEGNYGQSNDNIQPEIYFENMVTDVLALEGYQRELFQQQVFGFEINEQLPRAFSEADIIVNTSKVGENNDSELLMNYNLRVIPKLKTRTISPPMNITGVVKYKQNEPNIFLPGFLTD